MPHVRCENCSIRVCVAKPVDVRNYDLEVKIRSRRRMWIGVSTLVYDSTRNHRRLIAHFAHHIIKRKKRGTAPQDDAHFARVGQRFGRCRAHSSHFSSFLTGMGNPVIAFGGQEFDRNCAQAGGSRCKSCGTICTISIRNCTRITVWRQCHTHAA